MKSIAALDRINLRERRANQLLHLIMRELDVADAIPEDYRDDVFQCVYETLLRNGAYIMTDEDRRETKLEPRDELGWTMSERLQAEQSRLDAMAAVARVVVPPSFVPASFLPEANQPSHPDSEKDSS